MPSQPEALEGSSDFRVLNTSSSDMSISLMFDKGVSISLSGRSWNVLLVNITKYSSTLYIGMDEVLAHYVCTFENSDLHFYFL